MVLNCDRTSNSLNVNAINEALTPNSFITSIGSSVFGNLGIKAVSKIGGKYGYSTSASMAANATMNVSYNSKGDSLSSDAANSISSMTNTRRHSADLGSIGQAAASASSSANGASSRRLPYSLGNI